MEKTLRRRRLSASLTLVAAGAAALSVAGASAHAATNHPTLRAPKACAAVRSQARVGRISGILRPVAIKAACEANHASDPANGTPPLIFHGGNVMGTRSTGPVVVTPIFWDPAGHPMGLAYKRIINTYLGGVAAGERHSTPTCTRR